MKRTHTLLAATILAAASLPCSAQYYELANQLTNVLQPALSGSFLYKGFVEGSYIKNMGDFNADYIELSTSQGFQYASWFYMGAGLGFDVMISHPNDNWGSGWQEYGYPGVRSESTTTALMMPLFTDFRFNIGRSSSTNIFFDLRIGASFLLTDNWIRINNGYLSSRQYFYLRPTVGVRIPTNTTNSRQAFNVGISYQLLTSNYWRMSESTGALSGLGVAVSYEW